MQEGREKREKSGAGPASQCLMDRVTWEECQERRRMRQAGSILEGLSWPF